MNRPGVLTIGAFDGVHRGHAALLRAARQIAGGCGAQVYALVFDPHPLTVLNPAAAPPRLSGFDDRAHWLRQAGADAVVRLAPDEATLALEPEAFITRLVERYRPVAIVEGRDFRFGRARRGDVALLAELGARAGFEARVVDPVSVVLDDHSVAPASSTLTRWLLRQGRVRDAAMVLGRPYALPGTVEPGDRRGRTIGFPTANLRVDQLLPADGVYAARAMLPDGRVMPAAVNVGERPTFAGAARTVEAHLLADEVPTASSPAAAAAPAWSPLSGLPEYGWPLRLEFVAHLRDQCRFAGLDALKAQLARDVARTRELTQQDALMPAAFHAPVWGTSAPGGLVERRPAHAAAGQEHA